MAQRDIDTAERSAIGSAASTFGDEETAEGEGPVAVLLSAFTAAAPIIVALAECDEELRMEAVELFKQLDSGELDVQQRIATSALLTEILFPKPDEKALPGVDLVEAEATAATRTSSVGMMDEEEAVFAERLRELMEAKGLTQADLASKVGIGQ